MYKNIQAFILQIIVLTFAVILFIVASHTNNMIGRIAIIYLGILIITFTHKFELYN